MVLEYSYHGTSFLDVHVTMVLEYSVRVLVHLYYTYVYSEYGVWRVPRP